MQSLTLLLTVLFLFHCLYQVHSAGSHGKCADSSNFECPHLSHLCGEKMFVSDCLECNGFFSTDARDKVCFERKLLNGRDNPNPSYLWRDILGIVVWFVAAGVATACGVGGGGIYVPLGILLLGFAPKPASGLSQASIFGASLGGLLLNLRNKHPFTTKVSCSHTECESVPSNDQESDDETKYYTRPLIDFDMALFLAPMEMAGAVLGVLIQRLMPNWLYLTLAAIILGFTSYKTYKQFKDTHQKELDARRIPNELTQALMSADEIAQPSVLETGLENEHEKAQQRFLEQSLGQAHPTQRIVEDYNDDNRSERLAESSLVTVSEAATRRQYWLERDSRQFPAEKIVALLVLWVGLVLLTFMKGGKGVDSIVGITCASPWYTVLIVVQFLWTMGISTIFGYRLMQQAEDKVSCDYPMHPQDVVWDGQKVKFYAFFTFFAGVVAGMIGVGGGMILGPLMLVMGINPRVSSATTATMIVLTSSSVAILFVTYGLVPWAYALTFFSVCFVGSYIGKAKIDGYVKKSGRASILIFLLAVIIGLATLGCVVIVIARLAAADWCFSGFNKFCTVSDDDQEGDLCPSDLRLFGK
jgi:uncharacterized membrane protein YfcA